MGGSRVAMLAAIAVSSHAWVQSTSSALHARRLSARGGQQQLIESPQFPTVDTRPVDVVRAQLEAPSPVDLDEPDEPEVPTWQQATSLEQVEVQ